MESKVRKNGLSLLKFETARRNEIILNHSRAGLPCNNKYTRLLVWLENEWPHETYAPRPLAIFMHVLAVAEYILPSTYIGGAAVELEKIEPNKFLSGVRASHPPTRLSICLLAGCLFSNEKEMLLLLCSKLLRRSVCLSVGRFLISL